MSPIGDKLSRVVSDHAVIRWLERVDGMDMRKVREEAKVVAGYCPETDVALLSYMRRYHRLDIRGIRRKIATRETLEMIEAGVHHVAVQNRRFRLVVLNGTITTVLKTAET